MTYHCGNPSGRDNSFGLCLCGCDDFAYQEDIIGYVARFVFPVDVPVNVPVRDIAVLRGDVRTDLLE